jgi:hypothetical protein
MDGECAFCGRAEAATHEVFCLDCQSQHGVCRECAEETKPDAATLGLVSMDLPQAA